MFVIGLYRSEVCRPLIEMADTALSEKVCLQVSHHRIKLAHAVTYRRAYTHKLSIMISLIYRRRKRTSPTAFSLKTEMNL